MSKDVSIHTKSRWIFLYRISLLRHLSYYDEELLWRIFFCVGSKQYRANNINLEKNWLIFESENEVVLLVNIDFSLSRRLKSISGQLRDPGQKVSSQASDKFWPPEMSSRTSSKMLSFLSKLCRLRLRGARIQIRFRGKPATLFRRQVRGVSNIPWDESPVGVRNWAPMEDGS